MPKIVLVVDDEYLVLNVLTEILEESGYQTVIALGGREALKALDAPGVIDLVVTDVRMPDVTGLDVCHAARRRAPDMPVIYVTGFVPDSLQAVLASDSRTKVIQKPFEIATLIQAVEGLLPQGAASDGAA